MTGDAQYTQGKQKRFDRLMDEGKEALDKGDRRLAHDLWREAATLDPYNEKVWLALYRVLNSDEDRLVCLQNIIAINPMNVQARRKLNALEEQRAAPPPESRPKGKAARTTAERSAARGRRTTTERAAVSPGRRTGERKGRRRRGSVLRRALLIGLLAGATGVLGGILASILIYGR